MTDENHDTHQSQGTGGSARQAGVFHRVGAFAKRHVVLTIAVVAVIATMIFVPPDGAYLDYVEWNTLGQLFCVLAVANSLRFSGAFDHVAHWTVARFKTPRLIVLVLVLFTGVIATVATNDLTLLVMLPFTATSLIQSGWERFCAPAFLLECLSANLCGMIMPFGNPHNLYLYSYYSIGFVDFLAVMAAPFAVSMVLIVSCTFIATRNAKGASIHADATQNDLPPLDKRRLAISLVLLFLTALAVFRVIPVYVAVVVVLIVMLAIDPSVLKAVDYPLLLTFICFFVFAGNMARMPFLQEWLGSFMAADGLLTSVLLSQVISNVPTSVLLSHFTSAWPALVVGTNIGGTGSLVGSLANLITFRTFMNTRNLFPDHRDDPWLTAGAYFKPYLILNFGFLIVLFAVSRLCEI